MDKFTEALVRNAEFMPDKAAYISASDGTAVSWNELLLSVKNIYASLLPFKGGKDPCVILVNRSPLCVAAMLAVNAAGGWYVPVDAELPEERIKLLLSVCSPCAVIDCAKSGFVPENIPLIKATECLLHNEGRDSSVNTEKSGCCNSSVNTEEFEGHVPDTPLFGIFTSGSTGMPKLVVKPFSAMYSFTQTYCRTFGFTENEIFGNQFPFYFDASTKDIYSTLLLGATCVVIPAQCFSFPVNLVKTLNDYRVSTIVWVPSALGIAAKFNVFAAALPLYLKNVLFVGERMPVKYLNVWMDNLPGTRFVNLYGSTEVAGNSCYYIIDRRYEDADILPIGRPFEGTGVLLLDPETGLEVGEGEIAVYGPGLATAYYRDPDKTASAFVTRNIGGAERRIYLSGDTGRKMPDGMLVCISRRDSQIKHMGHRIELGEIECAACALDFTDEACCFYDSEKEKIILYFSSATDTTKEVRQALAGKLPKYMLPHKYIYLPSLPHNRNGKIDRAGLKKQLGL